jgi:DNA-binding transcriptional MerR regulator
MAQAHQTRLLIGPIATATGLTPDAVRYYERLGLLPTAPRSSAGFRLYSPDTIEHIQFIKRAQQFGLALREIRATPRTSERTATRAMPARARRT